MAAQRGRLMLIYIGSGTTTPLGGLRTTTFTMNNSPVDVSTKDTDGWRELLEDGSLKFVSISGDGIYKNSTSDQTIFDAVRNGSLSTFTLKFPNGDLITGTFLVTNYSRSGGYEGAETFTLSLESSGEPTFTFA